MPQVRLLCATSLEGVVSAVPGPREAAGAAGRCGKTQDALLMETVRQNYC